MTTVKAIKKRIKLNEQKLNIEHPLFTIFGGGGTFHRWNSTRGAAAAKKRLASNLHSRLHHTSKNSPKFFRAIL